MSRWSAVDALRVLGCRVRPRGLPHGTPRSHMEGLCDGASASFAKGVRCGVNPVGELFYGSCGRLVRRRSTFQLGATPDDGICV
jgi:hypothetical protein